MLHRSGADEDGPWCWTFPSGGCEEGETLNECARRELHEETGLDLEIERIDVPSGYPVFIAEAGSERVRLDDPEHDRFEWVTEEVAVSRLLPERVAESLRVAAALARGCT